MLVLVTGFEPFGGDAVNASGDVLPLIEQLWDRPDVSLTTALLPVTFSGAARAVSSLASTATLTVCLGEAGSRSAVTPERWAHVIADARIPDNEGYQPRNHRLDDGPDRVASTVEPDVLTAAVISAGVPAETSEDAGRFVCNATFRAALVAGPAAFIHVPALRPHGARASIGAETDNAATQRAGFSMDALARGLVAAISAAIDSVEVPGGVIA